MSRNVQKVCKWLGEADKENMSPIRKKLGVVLVAPTNSMVVRRAALCKEIRHLRLAELRRIPSRFLPRYINYMEHFAGTPRYSVNSGLLALAAWMREHMKSAVTVKHIDMFGEAVLSPRHVQCRVDHKYPGGDLLVVHGLSMTRLRRRLDEEQPDIVGVNCFTTAHHVDAVTICQEIRAWGLSHGKPVSIVIGGVHPSALDRYFASLPCVDYVVRGEGEETFAELVGSLQAGKEPSAVRGLTYRSQAPGVIVRTPDREPLNVRRLPWIARDLIPTTRGKSALYLYDLWHQGPEGRPFDVIMRSRGCPYAGKGRCRNCASATFFAPFRSRRVADCLDEVAYLARRGVKVISDESDQVLLPIPEFLQFCRGIIERGLHKKIEFITPNGLHVGTLRKLGDENRRLMVEAGYRDLCLAVEGNQDYLDTVLRKRVNTNDVEPVCRSFRRISNELGKPVVIRAFVMLDGPGATEPMAARTVDFSRRLIDDGLVDQVIPFIATPIAGSAFFETAMEKFSKRVLHNFSAIYLPKLIPHGSLDRKRGDILRCLEQGDRNVIYDIFHEMRVWPAFRYGLGRVQSMFDMDGEFLERTAQQIHDLCPTEPFRIG